MRMRKTTAKGKGAAKETAADKQIRELNTDALMKMNVGRFYVLREGANPEQRKRLDYLLDRAHLKNTIRTIVREELAAVKQEKDAARDARIKAEFKRIHEELAAETRRRRAKAAKH